MGILDWLSDAIGSGNSIPSGALDGMGAEGVPPMQPQALMPQTPPPAPPGGIGSDAGAAPNQPQITPPTPPSLGIGSDAVAAPNQPPIAAPLPPPQTVQPPPVATPPAPPPAAALPPGSTPNEGAGMPPGPAGQNAQAQGFLGRALGLDRNTESRMRSSLGAGLTAAGNSAGKSPFQALASGAGASLEGGTKADDKTTADQQKYLSQAISAMKAGDEREANKALTELRLAQADMTRQGKMGKESVMNSDQQLYRNAVEMANKDQSLAGLRYQVQEATRSGKPADIQAAQKALNDAYEQRIQQHAQAFGLDPNKILKVQKMPGMSEDSALPKTTFPNDPKAAQAAFDKLPPGTWFINPKDGKKLMKPFTPVVPGGQQPQSVPGGQNLPAGQGGVPAPTSSNLPPLPPSQPTQPVASADTDNEAERSADENEPG